MPDTPPATEHVEWERQRPHPFDPIGTVVDELAHSLSSLWHTESREPPPDARETAPDDVVWAPHLDVVEDDERLIVNVFLPGAKQGDVRVELDQGHLVIHAEHEPESGTSGEDDDQREFAFGSFVECLPIPFAITTDQIQVSFHEDVLTVTLPKPATRTHSKPRELQVSRR